MVTVLRSRVAQVKALCCYFIETQIGRTGRDIRMLSFHMKKSWFLFADPWLHTTWLRHVLEHSQLPLCKFSSVSGATVGSEPLRPHLITHKSKSKVTAALIL